MRRECKVIGEGSEELSVERDKCITCKKQIPEGRKRRHAVFCSIACRRESWQSLYPSRSGASQLSRGTVGAISELRVAVDLLARGFEVFRALSSNCSCDLIATQNGKLLRVEVKTGTLLISGAATYDKKQAGKVDLFAIALDSEIRYDPPFTEED